MQLDLFEALRPVFAPRVRAPVGWCKCDCGLVFWEWPQGARHAGEDGPPNLYRFRYWTCWRGLRRCTPARGHA